MSPVSRGRKGKRNKSPIQRPVRADLFNQPDECDCPSCSGEDSTADFDPQRLIDDLIADAADLVGAEDPLDAEIGGAAFVALVARAGDIADETLVRGFIPQFAARASTEALVMLLAIGSVAGGRASAAASAAADRLVAAGVAPPGWAAELSEPATVADCRRLTDSKGDASMLACSFHRAGRSHGVVMTVDHHDCGAAGMILLLGPEEFPEAFELLRTSVRATVRDTGVEIMEEALDPAEFRWQVEKALDARAVHDNGLPGLGMPDEGELVDEDGPSYPVLAVLLRARMNALPVPSKPAPPHGDDDGRATGTVLQMLTRLGGSGAVRSAPRRR